MTRPGTGRWSTRVEAAANWGDWPHGARRGNAAMGALRKAGVWLGLIEDEDDRHYDAHGYDDDFEDEADEVPAAVRPRAAVAERLAEAREAGRTERVATRPVSRPTAPTGTSYPT